MAYQSNRLTEQVIIKQTSCMKHTCKACRYVLNRYELTTLYLPLVSSLTR